MISAPESITEATEVTVPVKRFQSGMFPWQRKALQAFDEGRARFASLMCHRRSRKTTLVINLMIRECCQNPRHLYRYIAPTRVEARDIVWNDPDMLFAALPPRNKIPWRDRKSELSVTFPNGSVLQLEGANKITQRHRGKRCNGCAFDEWGIHENPEIWPEIIRPMISDHEDNWTWFLFTPKGLNHATEQYREYERQIEACEVDDVYVQTLKAYGPEASGIISKKELARIRKDTPDALYRQEYGCEILVSGAMILIQPHVVDQLRNIHHSHGVEKRIIACDPAFGGDECVIQAIVNTEIIEQLILHVQATGETGQIIGALNMMGQKYEITDFIIDNIGYGKGVIDGMRLCETYNVQDFDARRKSDFTAGNYNCFNRRAEGWWYLWQEMVAGRVGYPTDVKLRKQLCSVGYKLKGNGSVIMWEKALIKKLLGESPDRADCFVSGIWGLRNVEPWTPPRTPLDDYSSSNESEVASCWAA